VRREGVKRTADEKEIDGF